MATGGRVSAPLALPDIKLSPCQMSHRRGATPSLQLYLPGFAVTPGPRAFCGSARRAAQDVSSASRSCRVCSHSPARVQSGLGHSRGVNTSTGLRVTPWGQAVRDGGDGGRLCGTSPTHCPCCCLSRSLGRPV